MRCIKPLILITALAVTGGGVAVGQTPSQIEMANKYGETRGRMKCLFMKQGIYNRYELEDEVKAMGGDVHEDILLMVSMMDELIKIATTKEVAYQAENCPSELNEYFKSNYGRSLIPPSQRY